MTVVTHRFVALLKPASWIAFPHQDHTCADCGRICRIFFLCARTYSESHSLTHIMHQLYRVLCGRGSRIRGLTPIQIFQIRTSLVGTSVPAPTQPRPTHFSFPILNTIPPKFTNSMSISVKSLPSCRWRLVTCVVALLMPCPYHCSSYR